MRMIRKRFIDRSRALSQRHRAARRLGGWVICLALVLLNLTPQAQQMRSLPRTITLYEGQEQQLTILTPFEVVGVEQDAPVIGLEAQTLADVQEPDRFSLKAESAGRARIGLSFLGWLDAYSIQVNVLPQAHVYAGGHAIGVTLYTQGALVVGASPITQPDGTSRHPAQEAGIQAGDIIERVNGQEIDSAEHLSRIINSDPGQSFDLLIRRRGQFQTVRIAPAQDATDNQYRLGLWVRDSTSGVGTLTYIDTATMRFGALGHGIIDADTETYLNVREGELLMADIFDVRLGVRGQPGELQGSFAEHRRKIGQIDLNCEFGIFGEAQQLPENRLYPQPIPISTRFSIREGDAKILCTVDTGGVKAYDCRIVKLNHQDSPSARSMIVQVTDQELIAKTGGIVQGMSGSPILQDGYLVGVVTHVFINDPTRGYGMYIDWMLTNTQN